MYRFAIPAAVFAIPAVSIRTHHNLLIWQIFSSGGRRINGFVASAASGFMYDIRRLDEMTREAISHVYQSTYYLVVVVLWQKKHHASQL